MCMLHVHVHVHARAQHVHVHACVQHVHACVQHVHACVQHVHARLRRAAHGLHGPHILRWLSSFAPRRGQTAEQSRVSGFYGVLLTTYLVTVSITSILDTLWHTRPRRTCELHHYACTQVHPYTSTPLHLHLHASRPLHYYTLLALHRYTPSPLHPYTLTVARSCHWRMAVRPTARSSQSRWRRRRRRVEAPHCGGARRLWRSRVCKRPSPRREPKSACTQTLATA